MDNSLTKVPWRWDLRHTDIRENLLIRARGY